MGLLGSIGSIAGPMMTVAGVMTGNPALAMAGIGASAFSASQGASDANQTNLDIANSTNQMSAAEAQRNRDFQAQQAEKTNAFNASQATATNAFNADQARINREWQASQTNTAYQRAVADLQAAGLNPMLAYSQGGASSGTGSAAMGTAASGQNVSGSQATFQRANVNNVNSQTVSSALQGAQTMLAAQNSAADIKLKEEQMATQQAQQNLYRSQATNTDVDTLKNQNMMPGYSKYGDQIESIIKANLASAKLNANTAVNVQERISPSSDPWYVRDTKEFLNSAKDAWNKKIVPLNKNLGTIK